VPIDYLLRVIEQTSLMLASIVLKRSAGRNDDARQDIERACANRVGLPFSLVRRSSPEALSQMIHAGGSPHLRSVLLAELLMQEAEINQVTGDSVEAVRARVQAFCLLAESIGVLSPEEQAVYRRKLDELARELSPLGDDPYLRGKLDNYRRQLA
jgi:hypothetical protein